MRRVAVLAVVGLGSLVLSCSLLVDLDALGGAGLDASVDAAGDAAVDAPGDAAPEAADAAPDAPAPCDLGKPFGAPSPVSGLDGPGREQVARFSPDLLTAYVLVVMPGINGITVDLLQYERPTVTGTFNEVMSLGIPASTLGTGVGIGHFGISETELDLVYVDVDKSAVECTRPVRSVPFAKCNKLTEPMLSPFLVADGGVLYGVGGPGGQVPGPATAVRALVGWSSPVRLTELDTFGSPTTFTYPVASLDERTLFFAAATPTAHVWRATRKTAAQPFEAPSVVPELEGVNGSFTAPTWLSADECTIFLVTDRIGTTDIFTAKRPK